MYLLKIKRDHDAIWFYDNGYWEMTPDIEEAQVYATAEEADRVGKLLVNHGQLVKYMKIGSAQPTVAVDMYKVVKAKIVEAEE